MSLAALPRYAPKVATVTVGLLPGGGYTCIVIFEKPFGTGVTGEPDVVRPYMDFQAVEAMLAANEYAPPGVELTRLSGGQQLVITCADAAALARFWGYVHEYLDYTG